MPFDCKISLAVICTNQPIKVKWADYMSDTFNTSNGVKQDGVLSPILFGIYFDELLYRLKKMWKWMSCR